MSRQLVIFDAGDMGEEAFAQGFSDGDVLFSATPEVRMCIGCFGCWLKTPGTCVLRDRCQQMPRLLRESDTVVVVSPLVYGGYSRSVKAVFDRSIGYLLPYFRMVDGRMHHAMRYDHAYRQEVHFYGPGTQAEHDLAHRFIRANAVNFNVSEVDVRFHENVEQAKEAAL